eukprot:jgi/Botrbrau1/18789/Bobra.0386s0104.2
MGTPGRSWTDRRVLNHSPTGPSFSNTTPSNGHAQGLRKTYSNPLEKQEAEALFETPSDLVCPITQDILLDPVINGAGQVYERSAIEEHLSRRSTDPVTGQQLSKKDLTPVWILRSKALEYRENTARQCVERASSSSCTFPERYVRRAAELCAGLDLPVQGLSRECVQYTLTHASNAYDTAILQLFAQGLFDAGYRDKAATVYYSLLRNEVDRSQQVDLLRRCLSCWTCEQNSGVDEPLIQKLGQLVEQQHTFSWYVYKLNQIHCAPMDQQNLPWRWHKQSCFVGLSTCVIALCVEFHSYHVGGHMCFLVRLHVSFPYL